MILGDPDPMDELRWQIDRLHSDCLRLGQCVHDAWTYANRGKTVTAGDRTYKLARIPIESFEAWSTVLNDVVRGDP